MVSRRASTHVAGGGQRFARWPVGASPRTARAREGPDMPTIDASRRRGTVYIAPIAFFVGQGRMVDPATATFWVSWQDDTLVEGDNVVGAEAAIAWGREHRGADSVGAW